MCLQPSQIQTKQVFEDRLIGPCSKSTEPLGSGGVVAIGRAEWSQRRPFRQAIPSSIDQPDATRRDYAGALAGCLDGRRSESIQSGQTPFQGQLILSRRHEWKVLA
jgi:hypothetical protein